MNPGFDSEFGDLYSQLRKLAAVHLSRESAGHTLQPTALVHEVLLRMGEQRNELNSKSHYLGIASQMMRRILIDHARSKNSRKRNEQMGVDCPVGFMPAATTISMEQLITVDELLCELQAADPLQGRIVEMRFFGGFSIPEIAEAVELSERQVHREWACARAWLLLRLNP